MFASLLPTIGAAIERVRELVAGIAVEQLDGEGSKELLALGEQLERIGRSLKASAAARVAATDSWCRDGDRSAQDWLARTIGTTRQDAQRTLEVGQQLAALPATAQALLLGTVSAQQAEAIAGAAAVDRAAEARLLAGARDGSLREVQDECRRIRANADADPEATARRIHAGRSYRSWTDADGVGHLHLSGPAATIKRIDNAVRHRSDQLFRQARRDGRREPVEAYAFDAVEALTTGDGSHDSKPIPRGADAKIIVRIDHPALLRGRAIEGEVCEIAGVGPIPVSVVQEWMDDAFVAAVLTKGTDVTKVVHLGRRFTSEQRTALQWRDPTCARRGCAKTLGLEYDHVEDWADTHTTRVGAAKRFCSGCHRLKTTGWEVGPDDDDGKCELIPPHHPDHTIQLMAQALRAMDQRLAITG